MEQDYTSLMIRDYDQLVKLPKEAYDLVIPNLILVNLKRGTVIKSQGQVDRVSRYLCEGFIGTYRFQDSEQKLFTIYKKTDTVFDETSFRSGLPSETVLKSISDVVFLEYSVDSESKLLQEHPSFTILAHKVAHRITERNSKVHSIAKLGLEKGYEILMKEFPGLEAHITNLDIGSFFGVSTRTAERWKHNLKGKGHD
ncbi:Crp/Fnr family transcriptional regulator [Algoriphagus boritolerans]|uniref:cAMP-binding domain of CRP or a regulatory subunit of cAMP-dependent protein kinases n=1 Tax=Algoriphagus boritolerans DSM 17298 = JCM 18970 TaxID=1120964 RepID=A0A1H5XGI4_9BACT|nr:Crp/Fnr family transcriptional regulator [Algoriphagus boritolerans]SEG10819.1 cAMP-binding domain of CRP or a regulatory subunit of cAMP-dependent protein kinases [Algoriphagus boritolerans DSM 17298 = JCM 18970]